MANCESDMWQVGSTFLDDQMDNWQVTHGKFLFVVADDVSNMISGDMDTVDPISGLHSRRIGISMLNLGPNLWDMITAIEPQKQSLKGSTTENPKIQDLTHVARHVESSN